MPYNTDTAERLEFGHIYTRWYSRFVAVAARYVRDRAVAEDIVGDALVLLWENRARFRDDRSGIPAWLFTVIRNRCLDWLDSRRRHLEIEEEMNTEAMRMVRANISSLKACERSLLFSSELQSMISDALAEMPEHTREVFLASRYGEKTYSQISAEKNISVRKVTSEIQNALAIMRRHLGDYLPFLFIYMALNQ